MARPLALSLRCGVSLSFLLQHASQISQPTVDCTLALLPCCSSPFSSPNVLGHAPRLSKYVAVHPSALLPLPCGTPFSSLSLWWHIPHFFSLCCAMPPVSLSTLCHLHWLSHHVAVRPLDLSTHCGTPLASPTALWHASWCLSPLCHAPRLSHCVVAHCSALLSHCSAPLGSLSLLWHALWLTLPI